MKTPEEYEDLYYEDVYKDIVDVLEAVQIESYNQAIKDAAEKITCEHSFDCIDNNEQSILKLLK